MCELLVIRGSRGRNNRDWLDGDVIAMQEDGASWGAYESKVEWIKQGKDPILWPNLFQIVKIPTLTVEEFNSQALLAGGKSLRARYQFNVAAMRNDINNDSSLRNRSEMNLTPTNYLGAISHGD